MDRKKMFVFGDSYSSLYYEKCFSDPSLKKYRDFRNGELPLTWSELLSNDLNYELINTGEWGSNNYTIFENVCKHVEDMCEGDIIIIGWSETTRTRFYSENLKRFENIGLWSTEKRDILEYISEQTINEVILNRESIVWVDEVRNWMKIINSFSKAKGIHIVYWTFFNVLDEMYLWSTLLDMGVETITDETNNLIKNEHMGEKGHQVQYEYIKKQIEKIL